jgi:predicted RNA-binding protein YlqC (UPF0109 family)
VGGGETLEGAGAAEGTGGGLSPQAPEAPARSDAPGDEGAPREFRGEREFRTEREFRPREPRSNREPDADDLRERDLVAFMARGLVDHPDDVRVEILTPGPDAHFELHVHQDDLGHVIGKQGRTARSLRLALGAAAARAGRRADLEIAD